MRLLFALMLMLSLSSCSYVTNFYIFNKTNKPIMVEYQISEYCSSFCAFVQAPRIVGFDRKMNTYQIENAYDFEFDHKTKTIRCELKAMQALWTGSDINFTLTNEEEVQRSIRNLLSLKIKTVESEIVVTKNDVIGLFKTFDIQSVGIEVQ